MRLVTLKVVVLAGSLSEMWKLLEGPLDLHHFTLTPSAQWGLLRRPAQLNLTASRSIYKTQL